MTTTPVPPHLSDEERALWEKATRAHTGEWYGEGERIDPMPLGSYANFIAECSPAVIRSLLTALSTEREAGERMRTVGARALEQWSERDGIVELDGFVLTHTDDGDLGVWTTDDAANGRTATEMFFEDDCYRVACEWFAARLTSTETPHAD